MGGKPKDEELLSGVAGMATPMATPVPVVQDAGQFGGEEAVFEEDESEFADPFAAPLHPLPPAGTKVIRVRATERKTTQPKAPAGFQAVTGKRNRETLR